VATPSKPRRAAGTRTSIDVLRNVFRPPTNTQKAADLADVRNGRELLVAARLLLPNRSGVHWVPQGHLHLFRDQAIWRGRGHPEMTFRRGEWFVRTTPHGQAHNKFGIVSFLSKIDSQTHHEIRVPNPDLDLVRAVLSDQ
jgi:hypothetical protein